MPGRPLTDDESAAYLREPTVLHWVPEEDGVVVGHLLSYVELRRAGDPRQLLLYEIGVRQESRAAASERLSCRQCAAG